MIFTGFIFGLLAEPGDLVEAKVDGLNDRF
jgi:hypothetical protein